jgi:hypothetical protein
MVAARKRQPTTIAMVRHSTPIYTPSITLMCTTSRSASERTMSQSNSDPDPESTDERKEEHEIQHFLLDKRGDYIHNFMTYNVSGFKHRPFYEEILQQQDNSNEQFEIAAIMFQSATNKSSNTTEEASSSSAVESQPKHGRGSLVQQVARRGMPI